MADPVVANVDDLDAPTDDKASIDSIDDIAELLIEPGENQDGKGDLDDEETLSEESNQDVDDNNPDEDENPQSSDEDLTWEGFLGLNEGQINFDEEGNLLGFNIKVGDEVETISASDVIAGFQNNKSNTVKSQQLSSDRKEFDAQKKEIVENYEQKLKDVSALATFFEESFVAEFKEVNWDELRDNDPGRYAAMRQDFSERSQQLQMIKQAIQKDYEDNQSNIAKEANQKFEDYKADQKAKLIEKNPTWADDKVYDQAMSEYSKFVSESYGFTDEEFKSVFDHRLFAMIQDAQKFRQGRANVNKTLNKPNIPKFQKSSGRKPAKVTKLEKLTAASKKATGSQKRNLQTAAISELLINNEA